MALGTPLRRVFTAAAVLALTACVLIAGIGWYYAGVIHGGALLPDYSPDELDLRVVDVRDGMIVLQGLQGRDVEALHDDELWGLEAEDGYGQVGAILDAHANEVVREFRLLSGSVEAGHAARLDSFAFDGDPMTAHGLAFTHVRVPSPLGELPAWQLDGSSRVWAIFVHGWRSRREEALRILPTVASLGLRSLVISYRNDDGAPASADGLIWWGAEEWRDLEAAVDYALAQGAESVVLYGYSMGGGIALRFLQESGRAGSVRGMVLDSPVQNLSEVLEFQARRRNLPTFFLGVAKRIVEWRYGFDWAAVNNVAHLERVNVPILLFHGDDDDRAPFEASRRLAASRPDIVTFVIGPTAGHVRTWNLDPGAYEEHVRDFLTRILAAPR